jgi:hypothetical protein
MRNKFLQQKMIENKQTKKNKETTILIQMKKNRKKNIKENRYRE